MNLNFWKQQWSEAQKSSFNSYPGMKHHVLFAKINSIGREPGFYHFPEFCNSADDARKSAVYDPGARCGWTE